MNVGDYVRTKKGYIAKYKGIKKRNNIDGESEDWFIFDSTIIDDYGNSVPVEINKSYFIKSSPNIIDLIGCGDVLIVKEYCDEVCQIFTEIYLIQSDDQLLNIKEDLEKNKNHKLYSILTKEMFEQMEYKIQ